MNESITISGKIKSVLFRSPSNSFSVLRFRLYELNEKNIIVTGYLPELPHDVLLELTGNYVEHPRFGMQFSILSYRRLLPTDKDNIIRYLSSPQFMGIGRKLAEKIVNELGDDALYQIQKDPDILLERFRLSKAKQKAIVDVLCVQDDLEAAVQFLSMHGLGIRNIMKIDKKYGKDSLAIISENPYCLIDDIDGIGFSTADKLALSMGFSEQNPLRKQAAMISAAMQLCMNSGDTYTSETALCDYGARYFSDWMDDVESVIQELIIQEKLILVNQRIYHPSQFHSEQSIASFFRVFPLRDFDYSVIDVDDSLSAFEHSIGIQYDSIQKEAITRFFTESTMILTGGPGTGKTTIVRGIVAVLKQCYPHYSVVCCAPTGRAAKRLKELTFAEATTIHSMLKWDLESNTFGVNKEEPLLADVLIIDEFSMVDNWLMAKLVEASLHVRKILFIGDEDQLPSVGPGSVLRDLIESKRFSTIRLATIYRQKEGSDVINLAHHVKEGEFDSQLCRNDVRFIESKPLLVKDLILKIVHEALLKGYQLIDIQVLAAKYNGPAGIDTLNHSLQKLCNPSATSKRELTIGYRLFREGDKILQLKNQPDYHVYNGDIGILVEIIFTYEDEKRQNRIIVDFDGIFVEYTSETFMNISHAYCISVHKSQGSEYPIVILPAILEYGNMLQRRLIYTGITRASRSLVLIGQEAAFKKAMKTLDHHVRKTTLTDQLKQVDKLNSSDQHS